MVESDGEGDAFAGKGVVKSVTYVSKEGVRWMLEGSTFSVDR